MTDYKLVPMEPTSEMVEAAEEAYMPFGDMDLAIRMAILAAPDVQGEPVAYLRKDQLRQVQRMGPMLGEIADSPRTDRVPVYAAPQAEQHPDDAAVDRFAAAMKAKLAKKRTEGRSGWQDATAAYLSHLLHEHVRKGDPVDVGNLAMMLHQNGQGVEQQPVCPTCYGRGWDMDCQNEFRPATCPDCAGSGKAEHSITVQESDSAAPDVTQLVEALEQGFPLLSDEGLDEVEHHCEWVIQRERKRVHSILAAYRKGDQP